MTVLIGEIVRLALSQAGDRYVFGSETSPLDPDPDAFDCSELAQWACDRAKVDPACPDGAFNQWRHCTPIGLQEGFRSLGALLFVGDGKGVGRDAITHVAFSLGNMLTIEARGRKWGVGTWSAPGRFNFAGRLPGVDYSGSAKGPTQPLKLRRGAKGKAVEFLQAMLNIVRKPTAPELVVDGDFGSKTETAVRAFQSGFNALAEATGNPDRLEVNGIAEPRTLGAIGFFVNARLHPKK